MKKIAFGSCALLLFVLGCKKAVAPEADVVAEQTPTVALRSCAADEVLQEQLKSDPAMRQRMEAIEDFTRKAIRSGVTARLASGGTIEIPVNVHVVYNTNDQKIDAAQVQSQIDVMNEDFQNTNADRNKLPASSFQSVASQGMNVHFTLANTFYKQTKTKSFTTNDAVKFSNRGGDDVRDPATHLNIWVCNLGSGLLGYAQFPGGKPATDGVVILYSAFGSKAKFSKGTYTSNYDLGRTATHEVGHWMNLRHIWGDDNGSCNGSDLVDDTPNQASENYRCPSYPHVSCSNGTTGDMFMNYMDYTYDACMYLFSQGQSARALAVFASGGPRASMVP